MKEKIIRLLVKAWLPGWKLIEPGYHRHKNPEQKKKVKKLPPPDVTAMEATLEI
jgi:hypothetical protein